MDNIDQSLYKTLLESTKVVPWKIDLSNKKFTYVGPQIEPLLGWSPGALKTIDDWINSIHPDDRAAVIECCLEKSIQDEDPVTDFRVLKPDGSYRWIRGVLHVTRHENGQPDALLGLMFDINEHKLSEQRLIAMQKKLEEYSFKDGLTEIANRRMFNHVLEQEWLYARRQQTPLSLIMIDIDYFKEYNDYYGHLQGDAVLKQVAQALNQAATRAKDFFARFGGEEFAFILPETHLKAATVIAERCRDLIFKAQIKHEKSSIGQLLTISIGLDTIVPNAKQDPIQFLNHVDAMLYEAKRRGRNQLFTGIPRA